ncbi:MAG: LmeA family phospholipid-binding protein [Anaerolineales bacterium]|nr:LmeA family phospholipid-binding protein [Anaerolineales bacterium]
MNTTTKFLLIFSAFSALACSIAVGGPDYPTQVIPTSADDIATMQAQFDSALTAGAESGVITVQITEAQLTSYLAQKIQAQTDPPFTDPQVLLQNGQIQLYGKIQQGYFTANMLVTMNVGVDPATGLPTVSIATADFGPVDAPEGVTKAIGSVITEAFMGSLGPVATGIRIETISIADGILTLTGRIK